MTFRGDVVPKEAFEALRVNPTAVLVDVRTNAELVFVGIPDLGTLGNRFVAVEWQALPDGRQNGEFSDQLLARGIDMEEAVYFICRSGVRSRFAAIAAARSGYTKTYNIAHGFEGDPDESGHRGVRQGWKADKLPWRQQ